MPPSSDNHTTSPVPPEPDAKAHIREHLDISEVEWHGHSFRWAFVQHVDGETYVVLRRSADTDAVILVYTMAEWDAFGAGARAGEFRMPALMGRNGQILVGLLIGAGIFAWLRKWRASSSPRR